MLNVSVSGIKRAAKVRSEGAPELVSAVEQGRIAVSQAANIATMGPESPLLAAYKSITETK